MRACSHDRFAELSSGERLFGMPADAGTRGNNGQAEPRSSRMVADGVERVPGGMVGERMLIAVTWWSWGSREVQPSECGRRSGLEQQAGQTLIATH